MRDSQLDLKIEITICCHVILGLSLSPLVILEILSLSAPAPKVTIWVQNVRMKINDSQHHRIRSQAVVVASVNHKRQVCDHVLCMCHDCCYFPVVVVIVDAVVVIYVAGIYVITSPGKKNREEEEGTRRQNKPEMT